MAVYDVMIIGAGPAGITAAIYAKRAGCSVVVFEELVPGGQVATTFEVENYPGFETIGGLELSLKFSEHMTSTGVDVIYGAPSDIQLHGKIKSASCEGTVYQSKTIIIASGTKRRLLEVEGEAEFTGRGVSYCATCDGNFFKGKNVAVVGGGNSAVEDAIYLSKLCNTVYLIHRRGEFRASKTLTDRLEIYNNIILKLNKKVTAIKGDTSVNSVEIGSSSDDMSEREILSADGVFIAVGSEPRTAILNADPDIEFSDDGAVIADETCHTGIDGVFVAGDVRSKPLRQIITAAADGAVAGWFAAMYSDTVSL